MARSTTRMVLVRQFMEQHEPSVLSVEFNKGDGYRLILVWLEKRTKYYVKGYGEDYVAAVSDIWQQILDERQRKYHG